MRESIIASKTRFLEEEVESLEPQANVERLAPRAPASEGQEERTGYTRSPRTGRLAQPHLPSTRELMDDEDEGLDEPSDWHNLRNLDPNLAFDDDYAAHDEYGVEDADAPTEIAIRPPVLRSRREPRAFVPEHDQRAVAPRRDRPDYVEDAEFEEEEGYEYEYEADAPQPISSPKIKKKRRLSRRGLLLGAGGAAAVGLGALAVENAPKIPQELGSVSADVQKQVEDAFNRGLAQGADTARKDIIMALENLEGFTLEGAIAAARLTRVAYDVFVSPVIKFGATITGDFLAGMLQALKTARGWLAQVYQDNATLIAIQKVLESWVAQAANMPKQLDTITQTDLDGAQAYLRALQRMVDDQKAKLNNPKATPTPASKTTPNTTPNATPKPTQKPS